MTAKLRRSGHPMPATLLTASLSGLVQAASPAVDTATSALSCQNRFIVPCTMRF